MDVELKVSLEEAVAIVQGAHPLWAKLKAQVEPHLPKEEPK